MDAFQEFNMLPALVFSLVLLLTTLFWWSNYTIEVSRYNVVSKKSFSKNSVKKENKSFTILHLSDLHNNDFLKKIKKIVIENNPDFIFITGDVVAKGCFNKTVELIDWLIKYKKNKIFYSSGNHETYMKRDKYLTFLKELVDRDVFIVDCDLVYLDQENFDNICISGLSGKEQVERKLLTPLAELESSCLNFLLMHQPDCIELIKEFSDIDFVFSGHAHGGQWRIPIMKQGIYAPNQGMFPKFTSGIYQEKKIKMFVSRGIGTMIPHIPRIFNRPHVIVVRIIQN